MQDNSRNPRATIVPALRTDARSFGVVFGFSALLLFTAVTIGARDDNTRALLLSSQRVTSREASMTVPPEPRLSYEGPIYLGGDKWNADGRILDSAAPTAEATAHGSAAGVVAGRQGDLREEHARGRPEAKGGEEDAPHLASALLRKAAPGLAKDVDTAGEIVHNTAHALGNIGEGMAKALDVKDTKVRPKAPVKMLTHV